MRLSLPSARTLRRIAAGFAIGLIALVALFRFFATTPIARGMVETRLEALSIRGQAVEIDGLKGDLLGRMSIDRLSVRDTDGVWAEAANVEVSWMPLSMLSGQLKIRDVLASELVVHRTPQLASSLPSPASGNSFLKRYTVQDLAVEAFSLSERVTGFPQAYTVSASLDATPKSGDVTLDLVPTGDYGDTLDVRLAWGGSTPLQGFAKLTAPASGLAASFLKPPADQDIALTMEASGSTADWQLSAAGSVGAQSLLDITSRRQNGITSAEGSFSFDQLGVLEPLLARLGDSLIFSGKLDGKRAFSGQATAETGRIVASANRASFVDGFALEKLRVSLSEMDAAQLTGLTGLTVSELSASGRLQFTNLERAFTGTIATPSLSYGEYTALDLSSTGLYVLSNTEIIVDTQVSAGSTEGAPESLKALLKGPLTANLDAQLNLQTGMANISEIKLGGRAFQTTAQGEIAPTGSIDMTGDIMLTDAASLSPFNGRWTAKGHAISNIHLGLSGTAGLYNQSETIRRLFGDTAQINLSLLHQDQSLLFENISFQTETSRGHAKGIMSQGKLEIDGKINTDSLRLKPLDIDPLEAVFKLSGAAGSPTLAAKVTGSQFVISGETLTAPHLNADISLTKTPGFSLKAHAEYEQSPLQIALDGTYSRSFVRIDAFSASWLDFKAIGEASLDTSVPSRSEISLALTGTPPILGNIDGKLHYTDQTLTTDLTFYDTVYDVLELTKTHLTMSGRWPIFEGAVAYNGSVPVLGQAHLISGAHDLRIDAESQHVSLDGAAKLAEEVFALKVPLEVTLKDGLEAQGQLSALNGLVDFSLDASGKTKSRFSVTDVSMARLGPFIGRPALSGTLQGDAEIILVDGAVNGRAEAEIIDLARGDADARLADIDLTTTINTNQLKAHLRARDTDRTLNLVAVLATELQTNGALLSIRRLEGALIPISMSGGGPIAPLWSLAAPPELRLEGDLAINIDNGSGADLRFTGPVTLESGVFEDGLTGLHLRDIEINSTLGDQGLEVQTASASGSRAGTLEASGLYSFDGSGSVTLKVTQLDALKRSDVSATLSGTASIDRRNHRTHVQGDLEIDKARIDLSKLRSTGYTTLDVVFLNDNDTESATEPQREAISLDLDVIAKRSIFVSGPSVESEWAIDTSINGPLGQPQLIGQANLIRGEADLLNRRFRFSEGLVRFVGDPADTQLRIKADRTQNGMTTSISLTGDLTDPEISLAADPPLPDDEILARVLFGRSPGELSPLQAAQLAGAAAQFAGGNAVDLTGQLQAATGLDRLDFGFDDARGATLSTGKYLADDIYLEVETGGSGAPGLALEWTPLDNVTIDAEVDPELGPKVAIQWKRDFDRFPGQTEDNASDSPE